MNASSFSVVSRLNNVKVTVGLCVKNSQATVKNAVDSIITQHYPHENMEIVVVDGQSKDNTLLIIRDRLSGTDIRTLMLSDEGKGLGTARSLVVDKASGDYIIWVDGDVRLPENHIKEQMKFMDQNPKVGMVRAKWKRCQGKNLVSIVESIRPINYKIKNPKTKSIHQLLGTAGSTFRTEAVRQIGNFDKYITGAGEDIDVAIRIREAGWLLSVNQEIHHDFRETWRDLWNEYFWYGYGAHYVSHKHAGAIAAWKRLPPVAIVGGILYLAGAYTTTQRIATFMLPFLRGITGTAWWFGFVRGHVDGYGHRREYGSGKGAHQHIR